MSFTPSRPLRARRLPGLVSLILAIIGVAWLVLASLNLNLNPTGIEAFDAGSFATNASGAILVLFTAVLGTLPRPTKPIPGYSLALVIFGCAIVVTEAIVTAKLAQQHQIGGSASSDILVITVAAIAAVSVYRSRPTNPVAATHPTH